MTASLWETMISRMTLMSLFFVIGRMLVPLKNASYFILSLLCLLVVGNPVKIIASWRVFFPCYLRRGLHF